MKTKTCFALVIQTMIFLGWIIPNAWALPLAPTHILYPMDYEYLLLENIESLPSKSQAQRMIPQCLDSDRGVTTTSVSYEQAKRDFVCSTLEAQASDWAKVKRQRFWNEDTQVLYFGERHIDIPVQKELAGMLDLLASEGFRILAMEMFPFSAQKDLDDFFNDKISLEEILSVLNAHWTYSQDGYAEILKSAKKNKIKIIGIDQREGVQNSDLLQNIVVRDDTMASQIALHLERNPNDKVIVYAGALHVALQLSKEGLLKSQVQKLQDLYQNQYDKKLNVESYVIKLAQKNRLLDIFNLGYELPSDTDVFVSDFKSLNYISGIIFIQ
ncbi:MAG: ChaN family lipoprotein [Bdellovibrionaceae bacterium]|nr:ChaN family lipoprotein [Pseudobdellovibrionaceae bacterium]